MYGGIRQETTMSVRLWTFVSFIAVVRVHGHSKTVLDFLTFYSGHWSNRAQIEESGPEHDSVEVWVMPVDIAVFRPNPVVLTEELSNGVVRILNLGVISDGPEKNSVKMKLFNFTDITQVKPEKFDVQTLKDLTLDDLHTDEDSDAIFHSVENWVFSGSYPYTSFSVHGRHPRIIITVSCHNAAMTMPMDTVQKATVGPYMFKILEPRYSMIDPPEDYKSPCDD